MQNDEALLQCSILVYIICTHSQE